MQVNGQAGLPTTGVAAVVASVMTINNNGVPGVIYGEANAGATTVTGQSMLLFSGTGADSNTVVIENGTDGKIKLMTNQTTNIRIDILGYFTVGNGNAAPGGYVSGAADAGSTGTLALNQASAGIKATGIGAVPITATAVFANLEIDATGAPAGSVGKVVAYPASTTPPATMLAYETGQKTMMGTVIDLDAQGMLKIKVTEGPSVTVKVNIIGYFDGQASNDAFTPLGFRIYDTAAISSPIPAGQTRDVQVAGVQGVPANGCSMAGVVFHLETSGSSAAGSITAWPSDETMPANPTLLHSANSVQSNTTVLRVGCADGKIKVRNNSPSGSVQLIVDAQNYFTNNDVVGPASGLSGWRSGSRSDAGMISRSVTDRMAAEINPTTGNLLLTQSLLNLTGVGPGVSVGVRYNAENDYRPTLNVGLFETQLYRNSNNTLTYTDPKGTAYDYSPVGDGTYIMPKNINAHLTRTVDGSPSASISAGATYELVFHPSQVKNTYVSDGNNLRLTQTSDVTGNNKITYTYTGGVITSLTDTQGRVVNFGYSSSPNPTQPTTITDTSLSRSVTLEYNGPNGALTKVTDATGAATVWAYGGNGKVSSITDGNGRRSDITYTGSENKVGTIVFGANDTAVSGSYGFTYTTGQAVVTDPNSHTATYQYNDTTKVITQILDGRGKATGNQFNAHGDLLKTTNPLNDATTYDVATSTYNLTKITSPTGGTGGTGAAGRTAQYVFPTPGGNGATADYRPTSAKDAQGNTTALTYNTWGQTATAAVGTPSGGGSPAGGTWSYKYQGGSGTTAASCGGKPGQLCQVTDGKGNVTGYAYNAAGNLTTMTPPAGLGAHTFTYDAAGRKISEVDGKGTTTYTCYDRNDRILQVSTTSLNCAVASGVTYTYDAAGNTITRKNATSTATIAYDAQNRPTSKTETAGTVYNSSVTYDRASNVLTSVSGGTGAANTTTYTYDAANNVASLAMPGGSCPSSTSCVTFGYDNAERRNLITFPSGAKTAFTYDTSGRPTLIQTTNVSGSVLVSRGYTYTTTTGPAADTALVGTVTDQTGNVTTYGYDAANRLTAATLKNSGGTTTGAQTFTYDLNGNRTQQVITGTTLGAAATTNYGYNTADQLCWSGTGTSSTCTPPGGATSYTYDGQGNQTSAGNTYNGFDQLTATTSGGSLTHTYAGTTNNERYSSTGTTFTNNLLNQVTQEKTSTATIRYVRDPAGTLIGVQDNAGSNYFYVLDNVKSVLMLVNSGQTASATYTYDPFGTTLTNTGTGGINTTNHYRYATGYTDPTGLTKLGARYYNPGLGRFTQTDPSGQESNIYVYATGNPATYSDPTGLCSVDDGFSDCGSSCSWGECFSDYAEYDISFGCWISYVGLAITVGAAIIYPSTLLGAWVGVGAGTAASVGGVASSC